MSAASSSPRPRATTPSLWQTAGDSHTKEVKELNATLRLEGLTIDQNDFVDALIECRELQINSLFLADEAWTACHFVLSEQMMQTIFGSYQEPPEG